MYACVCVVCFFSVHIEFPPLLLTSHEQTRNFSFPPAAPKSKPCFLHNLLNYCYFSYIVITSFESKKKWNLDIILEDDKHNSFHPRLHKKLA